MFGKKQKTEAELNAEFLPDKKYLEGVDPAQFHKVLKALGMPDRINPVYESGKVLPAWAIDYLREHEPVWAKCYFTAWSALAYADEAKAGDDAETN